RLPIYFQQGKKEDTILPPFESKQVLRNKQGTTALISKRYLNSECIRYSRNTGSACAILTSLPLRPGQACG
ncbi:hypothetical protein JMJ77_0007666, partial [Colletotrichum scovillei]